MQETFDKAEALLEAGRPADALVLVQPIAKRAPGRMRAQMLSARSLIALERPEDAVEHLDVVLGYIDEAPRPAMARANLARVYGLAGQHDRAEGILARAVEIEPGSADIVLAHADALTRLERWTDALAVYERVLSVAPDEPALLRSAGIAAQMTGDRQRAVGHYERAVANGTQDDDVYSNLNAALIELDRAADALAHARGWLAARPRSIEAMAFLALLEVENGNGIEAARWFDFDRFVSSSDVAAPDGYPSTDAFNQVLQDIILGHDRLETPPEDDPTWHHPKLRIGRDINENAPPAVSDLEKVFRQAVDRYFATMRDDDGHPFPANKPDDYDIVAWSAVLDGEGNQLPHIHMSGYLSGCYYVTIPEEVSGAGETNDGAFEMGRPPVELPFKADFPSRTVKPHEGLLLLFPAFMYHGTVPFKSKQKRICVAFDVIPKWEDGAVPNG